MEHNLFTRFSAALIAAAMFTMPFIGCSKAPANSPNNTAVPTEEPTQELIEEPTQMPAEVSTDYPHSEAFDAEKVAQSMKVTEQYFYTDFFGETDGCFVIENPTEFDLEYTLKILLYDAEGKLLDIKESFDYISAGQQALVCADGVDQNVDEIKFEFEVKQRNLPQCAVHELSWMSNPGGDGKLIMSVTNNNSFPANFIQADILFFKNGKLIEHRNELFGDINDVIPAGETITKSILYFEEYDSILVFFQDSCWR